MASDTLMQDTLRRLARIEAPQTPRTLLIPQWNEHRLPDGSLYWSRPISYDLPMLLLVTDIDLRETGALSRVENFLARSTATSGEELEGAAELGQERDIWLAFSGAVPNLQFKTKSASQSRTQGITGQATVSESDPSAFKIVMVDHAKRTTLPHIDRPHKESEDEVSFRLAMEKSYWSFVEAHPAHRSTSERDRDEAMDFLAWCLADQLVQVDSEQGTNYPFTLAQCRELMDLIRSVDDDPAHGRSTMVKTRIVAKVSLRNVTWRQILYNSTKEEANGVPEEPSLPGPPVAALSGGQVSAHRTTPPVNNGVVRSGLRMMVSRMLGYA